MKDERISIRIKMETKIKLQEMADSDGRSLSAYIVIMLDAIIEDLCWEPSNKEFEEKQRRIKETAKKIDTN